jgi:hypothetical protein
VGEDDDECSEIVIRKAGFQEERPEKLYQQKQEMSTKVMCVADDRGPINE